MNDKIANSLKCCFISPNVGDSNMEPANVVDVIEHVAMNLDRIARAITPIDAMPAQTDDGGSVGSLTEAVFYVAKNLGNIAEAIDRLSDAITEGP